MLNLATIPDVLPGGIGPRYATVAADNAEAPGSNRHGRGELGCAPAAARLPQI